MRILVIGDLHGRRPRIPTKDFDCIVVIGDICSDKEFRPIFKYLFKEVKENPNIFDEFSYEDYFGGKRKLKNVMERALDGGNRILKMLDKFEKPIFMVPGNWDQSSIKKNMNYGVVKGRVFQDRYDHFNLTILNGVLNPKLIKGIKNLKNILYRNIEFEGINFVGYGITSSPEEINKKLDFTKEQNQRLKDVIKRIHLKLSKAHTLRKNKLLPTFFVSHNVPYNTKLDIVKNKNSYANGMHLGSIVARRFCTKYKPLICVGGHIHECQGKDKIGNTLIVNTGFGSKSTVIVDIDVQKKKIKKVSFIK